MNSFVWQVRSNRSRYKEDFRLDLYIIMDSKKHTVVMIEEFHPKRLMYIINHYETLEMPTWLRSAIKDKIEILRKYHGKGPTGRLQVKYEQKNGRGRHYAKGSISQQSMPHQVRHTIAGDLYDDLDIVNCLPTILHQYCQKNGISCPTLEDYVNNREERILEVTTAMEMDRDEAKIGIVTIINGGRCYNGNYINSIIPRWVLDLKVEMENVREIIFEREKEFANYAKSQSESKKKEKGYYNPQASCMSSLIFDIEDKMLMVMRDYLMKQGVIKHTEGVLVFDGIQIRKIDYPNLIKELEQEVFSKLGYRITIKSKPMTDVIKLPDNIVEDTPQTLIGDDDNEASRIFLTRVGDNVRKCEGIIFVRVNGIWTSDQARVDDYLMDQCLDANFVKINSNGKRVNYSSKVSGASAIITATKARIPEDRYFIKKLSDSNRGKLVFLNGYWDFAKKSLSRALMGLRVLSRSREPSLPKRRLNKRI